MPSLNIAFSDDEHAQVTEAARASGRSLKRFVHDSAVESSSDYRSRVAALSVQIAGWSGELNERLK